MENMVAQILRANGHRLFFHSFYKGEGKKNRYEVDFLVRSGNRICPIEVKSSGYSAHSSLDYLMKTYLKTLGQAYILYSKDFRKDGNILFLPLYMAVCLRGGTIHRRVSSSNGCKNRTAGNPAIHIEGFVPPSRGTDMHWVHSSSSMPIFLLALLVARTMSMVAPTARTVTMRA